MWKYSSKNTRLFWSRPIKFTIFLIAFFTSRYLLSYLQFLDIPMLSVWVGWTKLHQIRRLHKAIICTFGTDLNLHNGNASTTSRVKNWDHILHILTHCKIKGRDVGLAKCPVQGFKFSRGLNLLTLFTVAYLHGLSGSYMWNKTEIKLK